jgi:hypothetical protein
VHHAQLSDLLTLKKIDQNNMIILEDIRKDPNYKEFYENRMIAPILAQKYQLALSKMCKFNWKIIVFIDETAKTRNNGPD